MSLDWTNERYVRVYTRDTTTWLMLPWQSRALLPLVFRKLDRAGVLDLGEDGIEALAMHTGLPLEVVEVGLPPLLRKAVLELRPNGILLSPNFLEAQDAEHSGKERAKACRERKRDLARAEARGVTIRDAPVTPHDEQVTPRYESVTPSNSASHDVTPAFLPSVPSVPCRAVVEQPEVAAPPPSSKTPKVPKGTRIPDDWSPTPELVARLRQALRVDPLPCLTRFRNHWVNARRNAIKPRWDLAFENWVEKDRDDGKLEILDAHEDLPLLRVKDRDALIKHDLANALDMTGSDHGVRT